MTECVSIITPILKKENLGKMFDGQRFMVHGSPKSPLILSSSEAKTAQETHKSLWGKHNLGSTHIQNASTVIHSNMQTLIPSISHTHYQGTPTLPDNVGVLKGLQLPQHCHLANGGQRHPFFLSLYPYSF